MATANTSLFLSNDTQARFNAWVQWVHDRLVQFGWTQTGDTGQIANPIVAALPAGNTAAGYEIWRPNDALTPFYVKIEYGTGGNTNGPSIWITVGTATNGAGGFVGPTTNRTLVQMSPITVSALNCWASGSSNRFAFALGSDPAQSGNIYYMYFGVERTKAADGTDNLDGVTVISHMNSGVTGVQFANQTLGYVGNAGLVQFFGAGDIPTGGESSSVFGADSYTFPLKPYLGYARNPIMNFTVCFAADFTREQPIDLEVYGATHKYMMLGTVTNNVNSSSSAFFSQRPVTTVRLMMRWE